MLPPPAAVPVKRAPTRPAAKKAAAVGGDCDAHLAAIIERDIMVKAGPPGGRLPPHHTGD